MSTGKFNAGDNPAEAEVEEPTNYKAQNETLSLVYSFASASDSDNLVFMGS